MYEKTVSVTAVRARQVSRWINMVSPPMWGFAFGWVDPAPSGFLAEGNHRDGEYR
jgi:hypothetical protein